MGGITSGWLRWQFIRLHRRWGLAFWLAVILGGGTLLLGFLSWRLQAEAERLAAFRNGVVRVDPPRPKAPVTERELQSYYSVLPHEEERFALVKRVLIAAERNGVLPQHADYKLETEPMTKVVRYQMSLPLKGDFARIQAFLVEVLNDNRSLAIDALNVKRESAERGDVEAQVQFSVLMRQL